MRAKSAAVSTLAKLSKLSLAERLSVLAEVYYEAGEDAAREAAKVLGIPMSRAETGKRWSVVEADVEAVEEALDYAEDEVEGVEEREEAVEEEYIGQTVIKRALPWR
ncbi:MAG: hypothetical protein TU35_003100 [Thermoproteus sp. AZ2]|uniref:Uncharacterized protein n=1 Tax=Thermoproteus sp. AZ2 TaxID=1609232 RepID=A0ACC6UZI0_9CREN